MCAQAEPIAHSSHCDFVLLWWSLPAGLGPLQNSTFSLLSQTLRGEEACSSFTIFHQNPSLPPTLATVQTQSQCSVSANVGSDGLSQSAPTFLSGCAVSPVAGMGLSSLLSDSSLHALCLHFAEFPWQTSLQLSLEMHFTHFSFSTLPLPKSVLLFPVQPS